MVIAARKGSNNSTDTNRPSRILFIAVATLLIVIFLLSIVTWIIGHSSLFSPKSSVLEYHHQLRTTSTSTNSIMGYTKEVIKEGNGDKPGRGQYVTVHCTGYGKDGDLSQKFWSTKDPGGEPFTFRVGMGEVIKVRSILVKEERSSNIDT